MISPAKRFLPFLVGFLGVLCLFNAAPAQAQQSSDNTLRALTVEVSTDGVNFSRVGLHPEFSAGQRSYDTVVSTSHTYARVTPTANHGAATLRVGKGNSLTPLASGSTSGGIALSEGANQIQIQVTAQDRKTETYYVSVTRVKMDRSGRVVPAPPRYVQATAGTNKLTLNWEAPVYWGSFPAGGYEVDWYAGSSPPTDASDWNRATPSPEPLASSATSYEFTGTYGDHTVADGTTYQLQVRAFGTNPNDNSDHLPSDWVVVAGTPPSGSSQSSDARLRALTASGSTSEQGTYNALTLTPSTFSATTTSYTATVANTITHVKLTPTVNDTTATVGVRKGNTGNFASVTSGSESAAISLSVGTNAITVRVTAQNSSTKDYTVTITRQAQSSDANLRALTASSSTSAQGTYNALTLTPSTFSATTTSYTATVANTITHVKLTPTVNESNARVKVGKQGTTLTSVSSGSESGAISLSVGANAITVRVTAQNSSTKDYTVTITRQAQSSDANLRALTASSSTSAQGTYNALTLTPSTFSATTTSYTATVPYATTHLKLTATVNESNATVKYRKGSTGNFTDLTSGSPSAAISLSVGANAITVRVTAQNSSTKDYTVTITRQAQAQSSDNTLSGLSATSATSETGNYSTLSIGTFASTTTSYAATVPYATTHVKLRPTVTHASATVTVGGTTVTSGMESAAISLSVGTNTITVQVTAQDTTTRDYTVTITRQQQAQSSDNTLSGLSATSATSETGNYSTLNIGTFASTTTSYTAMVANTITHVKLTPTVNDTTATVGVRKGNTGNFASVTSGSESGAISLSVGANAITVRVTAQNSSTRDYTVTITRQAQQPDRQTLPALSSDASLKSLEIEEASIDFDPGTYVYTLNVYGEATATLTPTANHEDAEITVNGNTVQSGSSAAVTLEEDGETSIEIVVTAEDGTTTRTYSLMVTSCPGEERKILEMFYESTEGDMWEENEGWNTEDDLELWHGVRTDEDGSVISLRLPDNNLSGDIPSALLCFEELSELALWDNDDLSGEIPDGLALPVERAALRDVAVALSLNTEWFEDYGKPFNFENWHEGVTTDDDGRVTELDFSDREDIEGTIPVVLLEQLERLGTLYLNCTISVEGDAPGGVSVEEVCEEPEEAEGGGCALSTGSGDPPVFGLFLMALLVFAVLGRRAR